MKIQNFIKSNRLLILFILFITYCILNSKFLILNSNVYAQSLSLSLSPPILEVIIKPGKSITQVYKITNNGESAIITPKIVEYEENSLVEKNDFIPEKWITIINQDIKLNQSFTLEKGQEKQIIIRINPPSDSKDMEIYRTLLFSTSPYTFSQSSLSEINERIASILLITVTSTGQFIKEAKITKFEASSIFDSFGSLKINIEVKNTGNTYFHPLGEIKLSGPIGQGRYKIVPLIIFPDKTRRLLVEGSSDFTPDRKTTLELSGFFLGKYQIETSFTLDESIYTVKQTKVIYAVPWKLALLAGIAVFTAIFARKRIKYTILN